MRKRIVSMLLLVSMILSLLTACGGKEETKVLRIAYFPNITHTQALVIKEQKKLEEALKDWTVEWVDFNAGPSEMEAFFAKQVDIGFIGPVPAVSGNSRSDGDIQIIAGATNGGSVLVARKGTNIKSVADLAGKKVAIPSLGNTQHLLLLKLMTENNMKPTTSGGNVEVAAVENANTISLMDAGEIDAALVPEPWGTNLINKCGAQVVLDYDTIWNNGEYSTTVVIARKEFCEDYKEVVETFMEQHKEATQFIESNKEEAAAFVNKQIKEATGKELDVDILNTAFGKIIASTAISKDSIKEYAEISKQEKFINSVPDDAQLFNESFLK